MSITDTQTSARKASRVADILEIQRVVLDFAFRDQNRWNDLRTLFAHDAHIHVSWYDGPIDGFIERSAAMAAAGNPPSKHLIGTPRIDIVEVRAVAETDITIMVRLPTPEGEVDMTSWARFYDLFEQSEGMWRIARRTAIYERDRLDPVIPGTVSALLKDRDFSIYPSAYKHMAFMLSLVGRTVGPGVPTAGSVEEIELTAQGKCWLAGGKNNAAL